VHKIYPVTHHNCEEDYPPSWKNLVNTSVTRHWGPFMWSGRTSLGQYLGVEEIEMVIVPKVFISWLHMTTQNVCPRTLFTIVKSVPYVMWSLLRSPEVNRSPTFDLSQNLEYG